MSRDKKTACIKEDDGPTTCDHVCNLFEGEDRIIWERERDKGKRRNSYKRVESVHTGVLIGECSACTKPAREISDFAPADHINRSRDRLIFMKACADYDEAYSNGDYDGARDARNRVAVLRRGICPSCAKPPGFSCRAVNECREFFIAARQEACERQGGCLKQDCPVRGEKRDARVMVADHFDPMGVIDLANKKLHSPSACNWWAYNGGIEKLSIELNKVQWICAFCHYLEPTGSSGRRYIDPELMEPGRSKGTPEEVNQYKRKHSASIRYPKQQYVDQEKLRRGCCVSCKRRVSPETCVSFHFDHIDETKKTIGADTIAGKTGGVAGIVARSAKRASLDKVKDLIDAEIALCQLLCANCHKIKTWGNDTHTQADVR